MMKTAARFVLLSASLLSLTACEGTKEQLGLTRQAPDEFAVVKRAPLEMPPDYSLRPPRPGAPRPQEQAIADETRNAVLGGSQSSAAPGNAESVLLQQTGGAQADPAIRGTVDREASETDDSNEPVAKRLFGLGGDSKDADVIDPAAEAERLHGDPAQQADQ